jgi:hypothetical protein
MSSAAAAALTAAASASQSVSVVVSPTPASVAGQLPASVAMPPKLASSSPFAPLATLSAGVLYSSAGLRLSAPLDGSPSTDIVPPAYVPPPHATELIDASASGLGDLASYAASMGSRVPVYTQSFHGTSSARLQAPGLLEFGLGVAASQHRPSLYRDPGSQLPIVPAAVASSSAPVTPPASAAHALVQTIPVVPALDLIAHATAASHAISHASTNASMHALASSALTQLPADYMYASQSIPALYTATQPHVASSVCVTSTTHAPSALTRGAFPPFYGMPGTQSSASMGPFGAPPVMTAVMSFSATAPVINSPVAASSSSGGVKSPASPPRRSQASCHACGTQQVCQLCGLNGHLASHCYRTNIGDNYKGRRQVALAAQGYYPSYPVDASWYLDTGATDHLTN